MWEQIELNVKGRELRTILYSTIIMISRVVAEAQDRTRTYIGIYINISYIATSCCCCREKIILYLSEVCPVTSTTRCLIISGDWYHSSLPPLQLPPEWLKPHTSHLTVVVRQDMEVRATVCQVRDRQSHSVNTWPCPRSCLSVTTMWDVRTSPSI